jgi:cation/acetate symporter
MIYEASPIAVVFFVIFVLFVLGLSFYFASRTKSAEGYFAAGGTISWQVNGIAFAGDYLSAASFLGICGMLAFYGYDGFLYSIGFLAGWVVALFVIAEPMKRLGKYTFTDALDSEFDSKYIQLMAAISTLIVSIFYLIPQMVGAGALVTPLLGLPHWIGVTMVGTIVIFIVATAGMTSTTYVQFLKGALLIIFSTVLVAYLCMNGINKRPHDAYHAFKTLGVQTEGGKVVQIDDSGLEYDLVSTTSKKGTTYVKLSKDGKDSWWKLNGQKLEETLSMVIKPDGTKLYNGEPKESAQFFQVGHASKILVDGKEVEKTGAVGPFKFLSTINNSTIVRFAKAKFKAGDDTVTLWYQNPTSGKEIMRPGLKFKLDSFMGKLNFVSLMLALFFGTAALPHILIRYYTVPSQKDARKSTIAAIAAIGFFYILTMFMGLGAMVTGVLDVESSNMAAPLLAKYFGVGLFSIISAIAFATVLGTVSGLIVASSGAVAHDLANRFMGIQMTSEKKVIVGKLAAIIVGVMAIVLGILFKGVNVSFLVGWAFAVAASANLPAILMLLFWKRTTAMGIAASIFVGIVSALGIILVSPSMYARYGLDPSSAPIGLDNPGIVSIPLSFLALVVVSLLSRREKSTLKTAVPVPD